MRALIFAINLLRITISMKALAVDAHPYVAQRAQKTLARLEGGAAIAVLPVQRVAPIESITKTASAHVVRRNSQALAF
jgi:hypothetical protein